jgi:hypothetical protein
MRLRFRYGELLFKAGLYDEAIPVLQEARNDPKNRFRSSLYIRPLLLQRRVSIPAPWTSSTEGHRNYELPTIPPARSCTTGWRAPMRRRPDRRSLETYGQLIQWDYNFRDVFVIGSTT